MFLQKLRYLATIEKNFEACVIGVFQGIWRHFPQQLFYRTLLGKTFFHKQLKIWNRLKIVLQINEIAPKNGLLLFFKLVFFNLLFVCPRPILSHYWGNSFTHPISITAVEFLSTAEILDGLDRTSSNSFTKP